MLGFLDLIAHLSIKIKQNSEKIIRDQATNLHKKVNPALLIVQKWKLQCLIMRVR